jgi:hypothetical protein
VFESSLATRERVTPQEQRLVREVGGLQKVNETHAAARQSG